MATVINNSDWQSSGQIIENIIKEAGKKHICPKCGKATRVGHSVKDGKNVRICRKCGAEL